MGLSKKERREQKQNRHISDIFESKNKIFSFKKLLYDHVRFVLLVIGLSTVVYFNGMNADFVSDDYASITQNPVVTSIENFTSSHSLVALTLTVVANVFGTNSPLPFHLPSLICFWIILILAFTFLAQVAPIQVAKLSVLLFSVFPVNVESVTWISGRPYLYGAIGILSSLLITIRYLETKNKKLLLYLILCFVTTYLGFHVRVLNILTAVFIYLVCFGHIKRQDLLKIAGISFLIIALSFVFFYPAIMQRIGAVNSSSNIGSYFYEPWYQYPTAFSKYLQLLLVPVDLTLYHTMYTVPPVLNWAVFILYWACIVYFWKKVRLISFGLLFVFFASAGSLAPLKVGWLVAERYVFMGGLGFALVLGTVFWNIKQRFPEIMYVLFVSMICIFSYRLILRNVDWQTNHNLWVNTCYVSPNSHNAWNNIGDDYDKLRDYPNAIKGFTQSTVVKPDYADAFHNRANILFKSGYYGLARESYETALKLNPTLYQSRLSLVQVALTEGDVSRAISDSFELVKRRSDDPMSHYALGFSLVKGGRVDEAKFALRKTLQLNPGFAQASELLRQIEK